MGGPVAITLLSYTKEYSDFTIALELLLLPLVFLYFIFFNRYSHVLVYKFYPS